MQSESNNKVVDVSSQELLNSSVLLTLTDMGFTEAISEKIIVMMSDEEKCILMERHMHSLLREVFRL
mgnify:CR=1 FL=1